MKVHTMPQLSPEWFACRAGKFTASHAHEMLATIKSGEAAARRDLRLTLAVERLTGRPSDPGFCSPEMQRGIELEPLAIAAYETRTGNLATPVGFCEHDDLAAGCSPDGLVGEDGSVSVKCPKSATHLGYLKAQTVPSDYLAQMRHELWITGRQWVDFVSFDDRMPDGLQLWMQRVHRVEADIAAYELLARAFLREIDTEVAAIRAMAEGVTA